MARYCRYEEVVSARQGGRERSENKWEVLRTRVIAGEEDRHEVRSAKREAQQERRCWGCVMETPDSTELFMEDQTWLDYLWDFETRGINLDLPSDTD